MRIHYIVRKGRRFPIQPRRQRRLHLLTLDHNNPQSLGA